MIVGRFAPTPSGPLHFGSLVTAVASYCQARALDGQWLLRIEDVDTPRVLAGASDDILRTLEHFGFEWDGAVIYQSRRFGVYRDMLQRLIDDGLVYACSCSRKSLQTDAPRFGPLGLIYPGHCRTRHLDTSKHSLRFNLSGAGAYRFDDPLYGKYELDLERQVGDIVLRRVDGVYAYHLAVTVDDALQGVNQIVRGVDLLEVTPLHLHFNRLLGFDDANYLHLPLVKTEDGKKLSKQTGAQALDPTRASGLLVEALRFLGQKIDPVLLYARPEEILQVASRSWDAGRIEAQR
jgi:glutamyl-Q tRNA(Asp) synthetase